MFDCIGNNSLYTSLVTLFANKAEEVIKLLEKGFVNNKCTVPHLSLIIQCIENIDLFDDEQKEHINILINRYRNA